MIAPFANQVRLDEAHATTTTSTSSFIDSRTCSQPFHSLYRVEFAREWGPCVLGIDQAVRGPLSGMGPAVFCGTIMPCMHETELESQGITIGNISALSGNDQERLTQMIQTDCFVAWILRAIPSEAADGARCSMGVLEHTTAASIIKEAIAAGVDVRSIRVSANCDPVRFRQFLYEAFPMIDDISVYPRTVPSSSSYVVNPNPCCQSPCVPQSLPSSPSSPTNALSSSSSPSCIPPVICAAYVVAQSARDCLSRQLLYKQRQSPSPLSRSPLSKPMSSSLRRRDRFGTNNAAAAASFFNGPLFRGRSSSEENAHRANRHCCAAFTGSEFGEAHFCGLASELSQPLVSHSQTVPIEMYDFGGGEDDDPSIVGLTSPKRIRVVPCSPPLPSVISCEDTLPPCSASHPATVNIPTTSSLNTSRRIENVDSFDSSPFSSTSLFVSPPPFASGGASTSVPMYRPMYGLTSPF